MTELRNSIIHGSKYPSISKTKKVGNAIKDYISIILKKTEEKFPNIHYELESYHFVNIVDNLELKNRIPVTLITHPFLSKQPWEELEKTDIELSSPHWQFFKNK